MIKVSRRKFVTLGLCIVVGGIVQELTAGCGGGGTGTVRQLAITASGRGSILEITADKFYVEAPLNKEIGDNKVITIGHSPTSPILNNDSLVFELNNGGELVGGTVSATRTDANTGDLIMWKSLL